MGEQKKIKLSNIESNSWQTVRSAKHWLLACCLGGATLLAGCSDATNSQSNTEPHCGMETYNPTSMAAAPDSASQPSLSLNTQDTNPLASALNQDGTIDQRNTLPAGTFSGPVPAGGTGGGSGGTGGGSGGTGGGSGGTGGGGTLGGISSILSRAGCNGNATCDQQVADSASWPNGGNGPGGRAATEQSAQDAEDARRTIADQQNAVDPNAPCGARAHPSFAPTDATTNSGLETGREGETGPITPHPAAPTVAHGATTNREMKKIDDVLPTFSPRPTDPPVNTACPTPTEGLVSANSQLNNSTSSECRSPRGY